MEERKLHKEEQTALEGFSAYCRPIELYNVLKERQVRGFTNRSPLATV